MAELDPKIIKAYKESLLNSIDLTWKFSSHEPCADCQPTRKNIFQGMLDGLQGAGYHKDVIERCKFALLSPQGFEVFRKLPNKFDNEYLVQKLLDVYKDITE